MATITTWIKVPTCLLGYIHGHVRFEKVGGGDWYDGKNRWFFFQRPIETATPILGKEIWGITHIQKVSPFGFLIMKPFCIYFWFQWKLRDMDKNGNWISGTERGTFPRLGYRWEASNGNYEGPSFYPPWNFHSD